MKKTNLLSISLLILWGLNVFGQYCTSGLGGNCTSRPIANVTMANMSNIANGCVGAAGANYADFTANTTLTINVTAGQSYYLRVKVGGTQTAKLGAWIDWNKDSLWSTAAEFYNITPVASLEDSVFISVPSNAVNGTYRLRTRSKQGGAANFTAGQACTSFGSGETEDYTLVVSGGVTPSPYCLSEPTNSADDDIGIFQLGGFTNTSIANATTLPLNNPISTATYTDFTGLAPIALLSPLPASISITQVNENSHFPCFAKVWIDLNHDSIFQDPAELVYSSPQTQDPSVTPGGNIVSGTITIPALSATVLSGITRLRVVLSEEDPNTTMSPCSSIDYSYGETEDYLVDIQQALGCAGAPVAGTTVLSNDTLCPNVPFTVSLTGNTAASGLNYQWKSATSIGGPFTAINGATNATYSAVSGFVDSFYVCQITCTNSSLSSTSIAAGYSIAPIAQCYCTSFATNNNDDDIGNFTIGSFSNGTCITPALNNPCSDSVYSDFTGLGPINLLSPLNYPVTITQINSASFYGCYAKVWIDFNKDGQFQDSTELVYTSAQTQDPTTTAGGNIVNGSINIPALNPGIIETGIMKMRVVLSEDDPASLITSCGSYGYGETEDYLVNLQQAVGCIGTPVAGNTVANDTTVCIGSIVSFSINGSTQASGITYQWQENGVNISGATNPTLTDTVTGPSTYQCIVTCANSGQTATSASLTLIINPFSVCYCSAAASFSFDTDIGNVTVGAFTNGNASPIIGNSSANSVYTNYTNLAPIPMFSGIPNTIQITGITASTFVSGITIEGKVWIDYNHDGTFDPITELAVSGTGNYSSANSSVISGSAAIPTTALTGVTGMRVMLFEDPFSNPCIAPSFSAGEVEDYLVNIQLASPCTGTPNGGNAITSDSLICPNSSISLNATGASIGLGITYQWQSASSLAGPYNTIANATNLLYPTDSVAAPTYFQCVLTCASSGQSGTSTPVFVDVKPFTLCYCNTNLGGSCSPNANNISFNSLSNPSTACTVTNGQAYTVFPDSANFTTTVLTGVSYPLSLVTSGTTYQITAFIDYNRDGIYDNLTERINVLPYNISNTQTSFSIPVTIPTTASTGKTGLRIRLRASSFLGACDPLGSGETEDYTITIANGVPCTSVPSVVNLTSSDINVCSGENFTLGLDTIVPASGISYAWTANGIAISGANGPNFASSISTTTIYACTIACAAGGTVTTNNLTVYLNAPDSCYCTSGLGGSCGFASIDDFTISQSIGGNLNPTSLDNQGSGCVATNGNAYSSYSISTGLYGILNKTDSFDLSINTNGTPTTVKVWTDWNKDGVWNNTNELVTVCSNCSSNTNNALYLIDTSANIGDTIRLRVRTRQAGITDACQNMGSGETEDYYIIISNATVLTIGNTAKRIDVKTLVFPNPTDGILNYTLPSSIKKATVTVRDLLGRTLISKSANNTKSIDLSELRNGTYTVTFNLDGKLKQSKVVLNK
jgi:GEVED domain/Secretion system C-terminal sorting domain